MALSPRFLQKKFQFAKKAWDKLDPSLLLPVLDFSKKLSKDLPFTNRNENFTI